MKRYPAGVMWFRLEAIGLSAFAQQALLKVGAPVVAKAVSKPAATAKGTQVYCSAMWAYARVRCVRCPCEQGVPNQANLEALTSPTAPPKPPHLSLQGC